MSVVFAFSDIFTTPTSHHPGHSWLRDVGISCKPLAAHTPGHFLSSMFWEARPITWRTLSKSPVSTFKKHLTSSNQSLRYQEAVDIRPNAWLLFNQRLVGSWLSSLSSLSSSCSSRAFGTSWQSQKIAASERLGGATWSSDLQTGPNLRPTWCPVQFGIAWSIPFFSEVHSSWR